MNSKNNTSKGSSSDLKGPKKYRQDGFRLNIVHVIVAIIIGISGTGYWVKHLKLPPRIYLSGIPSTSATDIRMGQQSICFKFPLNITVYNPNIVNVNIKKAILTGALKGTDQTLFRTTVYDQLLRRESNTSFVQIVDVEYDILTDDKLVAFRELTAKCTNDFEILAPPPLSLQYTLVAEYNALGFTGEMRHHGTSSLICPLNMMGITLSGSFDSLQQKSMRFLVDSIGIAGSAMDAYLKFLGSSLNVMKELGSHQH